MLSVSVDGGDRVAARNVILFDDGVPIAGALQSGDIVIYADAVRDYRDLIDMLDRLGIRIAPAQKSNFVIQGSMP